MPDNMKLDFEGKLTVKGGGRYGFFNEIRAISGYTGPVPVRVFVHPTAFGGTLPNGGRATFSIEPSTKAGHEGEYQARVAVAVSDEPVAFTEPPGPGEPGAPIDVYAPSGTDFRPEGGPKALR